MDTEATWQFLSIEIVAFLRPCRVLGARNPHRSRNR